jgi:hypothetical protein
MACRQWSRKVNLERSRYLHLPFIGKKISFQPLNSFLAGVDHMIYTLTTCYWFQTNFTQGRFKRWRSVRKYTLFKKNVISVIFQKLMIFRTNIPQRVLQVHFRKEEIITIYNVHHLLRKFLFSTVFEQVMIIQHAN